MLSILLALGLIFVFTCAVISAGFWVLLAFTWWKMEKDRSKNIY